MARKEWTENIITVRYVATPFGRERVNPPSLGAIREFVALCEGLPDDALVRIDKGHLDEGGRHDVTFDLRIVERVEKEDTDD